MKHRMFLPLIIVEVPSLSMTDGRAVAHVLLPWERPLFDFGTQRVALETCDLEIFDQSRE